MEIQFSIDETIKGGKIYIYNIIYLINLIIYTI